MSTENGSGLVEISEKTAYVSGGALFLLGAPGIGLTLALAGLGLRMLRSKK